MRILLVMPTPFENGRLGLENVVWLSEPVALTSIAAAAGPGHQVRLEGAQLARQRVFWLEPQVEHADLVTRARGRRDRGQSDRLRQPDDVFQPEPAVLERRGHDQEDAHDFLPKKCLLSLRGQHNVDVRFATHKRPFWWTNQPSLQHHRTLRGPTPPASLQHRSSRAGAGYRWRWLLGVLR